LPNNELKYKEKLKVNKTRQDILVPKAIFMAKDGFLLEIDRSVLQNSQANFYYFNGTFRRT